MVDINGLKSDIADLLIQVEKRRSLEAAKRRRQAQLDYDKARLKASLPKDVQTVVLV